MTTASPSTTSLSATSTGIATPPRWLVPLLRIDGIGSIVIGVALVAAAGWLSDPLGLVSALPVVLVGALFVVNGPVNLRAAASPTPRRLVAPIGIDSLFGVVMLVVAVADPAGADLWARWAVAVVAVMSFDLAAVKAWGRHRLA